MSDLLKKTSNLLSCSFIICNLSKLLTGALLSWATWAICSQLLICHKRPEQFPHSCSFVLSDLSKSLKVAHYNEQFWANERWVNELMRKFQPWNQVSNPKKILSYENHLKFVLNIGTCYKSKKNTQNIFIKDANFSLCNNLWKYLFYL